MKYLLGLLAIGALFAAINQAHADEENTTKSVSCKSLETKEIGSIKDVSCDELTGTAKNLCNEIKSNQGKSENPQERAS